MVYVVLGLGFIVGIYAVTRFFLKANSQQIKTVMTICAAIFYIFVLLVFAFSGRVVISIILLIPFIMIFAQRHIKKTQGKPPVSEDDTDEDQN